MLDWLKKNSKWATYFLLGALLIAVYKTFDSLGFLWGGILRVFSALKPFIIAFAIAYMLNIPTKKLKTLIDNKIKWKYANKHSNGLSITIVYVLFIIIFIWLIGSIVPAMIGDIMEMYQDIPSYAQEIVDFANNSNFAQKIGFKPETLDLSKKLMDFVNGLFSTDVMKNGIKTITTGVWSFASGFINVFIALIASVYMLLDKERILRAIQNLADRFNSHGKAGAFIRHWSNINEVFTQYIYARLTTCIIMAVACSLILIIMGEKYALLLGIFIGFMDIIPYFGSIISWIVGFVIMTISGGLSHGIWCSAMMLVMQQIDGNIISPKLTGERLEIRPLAIIIAVSVGGSLFGFVGMLISVPVVAILRAIISELLDTKILDKE